MTLVSIGWASADEIKVFPASEHTLGLLTVVRQTLANNPDIQLREKQFEITLGALQQASGQFDSTVGVSVGASTDHTPLNLATRNAYAGSGFPLTELTSNTSSSSLMLNTPFRNGIVFNSSIDVTRTTGTLDNINNQPSQSTGAVNFNIIVPLLRGGGDVASAGESAAHLEWEASEQNLRFSISQSILGSVTAYWTLLAASKILDIARESEISANLMLDQTQTLIAADELPAADLNMLKANLLDRTESRISAEQNLFDARLALGLAIGLPYQQTMAFNMEGEFPNFDAEISALEMKRTRLVELGMKHRADRYAAQLLRDSAKTLVDAARNNLQPQLNLSFSVGYAGLAEGTRVSNIAGGVVQNRTGINKGAQISYQWPFDNNSARGTLLQQSASYDQSSVNLVTVERTITTGIESALSNLLRSALKLNKSEETVELYRLTFENEKIKHKLGSSTLIDVLSTNDRLINASMNNTSFKLNYLNALAKLVFETGTLITEDAAGPSIQIKQLIRVPEFE